MQKTVNQVFQEYLDEQKPKLSARTFKYCKDAVTYLSHSIDGYGHLTLSQENKNKFDENYDKGVEFCDTFEPQILDDSHFSEFLGYFLPKKVCIGHDSAKKICGAAVNFYKWMVKKKYILLEEDGDEIELQEAVGYLRECFRDGWEEYNNFDDEDLF